MYFAAAAAATTTLKMHSSGLRVTCQQNVYSNF